MALEKRGEWWYGDSQADIRAEIGRYSDLVGYVAEHFADAVWGCGGRVFELQLDDNEGVASRKCVGCDAEVHPIGDSGEYMEDAELEEYNCPCGEQTFEITVGVSLYAESEDVRWLYVSCQCPACGLTALYGDSKNEFERYRKLLAQV